MTVRVSIAALALLFAGAVAAAPVAATTVTSYGDAYVLHDEGSDAWTIGSSAVAATYSFGPGHELRLAQILSPATGRGWSLTPGRDADLTIDGKDSPLTTIDTGLAFAGATATAEHGGVRLVFTYERSDLHVRVLRTYACYPQSPVVETWTRVESSGANRPVSITAVTTWHASLARGTVRWLNGLLSASSDPANDDSFQPQFQDVAAGDRVTIGSDRRSSETSVPLLMIDGAQDEFVVGSIWSGAWQIAVTGGAAELAVSISYPAIATSVTDDRPIELPHGFFGMARGGAAQINAALRPFVDGGLRQGRPFSPLVTYNTWFAYGVDMDADAIAREIEVNAALGVELFVVDAGWTRSFWRDDRFDYASGLGTWEADTGKFPDGLRPLRDLAHQRGMKFGVWVEPERVHQVSIGLPGWAEDSWLAKHDGSYDLDNTAQICLAGKAGRAWILDRLIALIDEVQPDYLKWDNNAWVNCNRDGHDHGPGDGSFAHVQGLYGVLSELRDRYPDLLIENVSGGGNRLDFGWLRYSDTAWMDDHTSPSSHVRHNIGGLATFFPPEYLLSFVVDDVGESLFDGDVPLYLRSRAAGILGMTYLGDSLPQRTLDALREGIRQYKAVRDMAGSTDLTLLTDPADTTNPDRWDALEEFDPKSGVAIVFAFRGGLAADHFTVKPRGLEADVQYSVQSLDVGIIGKATGASLMQDGVEMGDGGPSSSHVLLIVPSR